MLFEAEWIGRAPAPAGLGEPGPFWDTVTDAGELGRREMAWARGDGPPGPLFRPELLADPRCAILACRRDGDLVAGIIACTAARVTGISNLFGAGLPAGRLIIVSATPVAARKSPVLCVLDRWVSGAAPRCPA